MTDILKKSVHNFGMMPNSFVAIARVLVSAESGKWTQNWGKCIREEEEIWKVSMSVEKVIGLNNTLKITVVVSERESVYLAINAFCAKVIEAMVLKFFLYIYKVLK